MKIVIATGGTGGHIYPATTLADKLMSDDKSNEILLLVTTTVWKQQKFRS